MEFACNRWPFGLADDSYPISDWEGGSAMKTEAVPLVVAFLIFISSLISLRIGLSVAMI